MNAVLLSLFLTLSVALSLARSFSLCLDIQLRNSWNADFQVPNEIYKERERESEREASSSFRRVTARGLRAGGGGGGDSSKWGLRGRGKVHRAPCHTNCHVINVFSRRSSTLRASYYVFTWFCAHYFRNQSIFQPLSTSVHTFTFERVYAWDIVVFFLLWRFEPTHKYSGRGKVGETLGYPIYKRNRAFADPRVTVTNITCLFVCVNFVRVNVLLASFVKILFAGFSRVFNETQLSILSFRPFSRLFSFSRHFSISFASH